MSTGEQLIDRVVKTVDDPSTDTEEVLALLNEGLLAIASTVRLPELETADVVETIVDQNTALLPDDYHRGIFDCQEETTSNRVIVLNSKRQMLSNYGRLDYEADVCRHVCRSGENLLYQPMTVTVRVLTISYYRKPTTITEALSPDELPVFFHKALFHYACFVLFDDMEDGVEGAKVNADKHEGKFNELVGKLEIFLQDSQSHPPPPIVKGNYL